MPQNFPFYASHVVGAFLSKGIPEVHNQLCERKSLFGDFSRNRWPWRQRPRKAALSEVALEETFSCKEGTACCRNQPEGPGGWLECQQHLALSSDGEEPSSPSPTLSLTFLLLSNINPTNHISKSLSRQLCTVESYTFTPALSQMLNQEKPGIPSPLLPGDLQAPFESAFCNLWEQAEQHFWKTDTHVTHVWLSLPWYTCTELWLQQHYLERLCT